MVNEENVEAMLEGFREDKEHINKRTREHPSTHILVLPSEIEQIEEEREKEITRLAKMRLEGYLEKYPLEDVIEAAKRNFLYSILLDSIPPKKHNPFIQ
jgi:hypothetical protein